MRKFLSLIILVPLMAACGVNDRLQVVTPQIVGSYPAPGSEGVAVDATVWASFDAAIDEGEVASSFTLTDPLGKTVVVTRTYDPGTFTMAFAPSAPLSHATTYEVSFAGASASLTGAGATGNGVTWSFVTEAAAGGADEPSAEHADAGDADAEGGDSTGSEGTGSEGTGPEDTGPEGTPSEGAGPDDANGDSGDSGISGDSGDEGSDDPVEPFADCNQDACVYRNLDLESTTVPENAVWTLDGVTIHGSLEVLSGATLIARNVVVKGHLQTVGAAAVLLDDVQIMGNASMLYGGSVGVSRTTIAGNTEIVGNYGSVVAGASRFDGNLLVDLNTAGVVLDQNSVGGNLGCAGNAPSAAGEGNVVAGSKSGQCSAL